MVVQATIKSDLEALYTDANNNELTASEFADGLATVIESAILSATVNFPISVQVDPSTGAGATTATGTLS